MATQRITGYISYGTGAPSGAPSVPTGSYAFYQDTATGNLYYWDLNAADWATISAATLDYPTRFTLWHEESIATNGNAVAPSHDSACDYGMNAFQNTSANADSFTQSFLAKGGTYTIKMKGITAASDGKIDWTLDGASIATGQDWYSASTTRNVVKTISSVTITGDARHVLRGTVNGKNASSAAYNIQLTNIWGYQASD